MADEQQDLHPSEVEAQKETGMPDSVQVGNPDLKDYTAYLKKQEQGKEVAQKYGEPSLQSLMNKVGSDGVFAQRIVDALISEKVGGEEVPNPVSLHPDSPQENNITGVMDHTTAVPQKKAGTVAENIPPTAGVMKDAVAAEADASPEVAA